MYTAAIMNLFLLYPSNYSLKAALSSFLLRMPRDPSVPLLWPDPARLPPPVRIDTPPSPSRDCPRNHRSAPGKCATMPAPLGPASRHVLQSSTVQIPAWPWRRYGPCRPPAQFRTRLSADPGSARAPFQKTPPPLA